MRPIFTPLSTLLLALAPRAMTAQPPPPPEVPDEVDMAFDYAEDLFDQQDWFRAVGEYKRTLYLMGYDAHLLGDIGPDEEGFLPQLKIGIAYYLADQPKAAADAMHRLHETAQHRKEPVAYLPWWMGQAFYAQREYLWAARRFAEAAVFFPPDPLVRQARWMEGWSLLEAEEFDEAKNRFARLSDDAGWGIPSREMVAGLEAIPNLRHRSPWVAGVLSGVLPGSGQLYAGEPVDGLMALLVNGLFVWGMVYAFSNDNVPLGAVLSLFEAGWYTGNLYAALNAAERNNARDLQAHLAGLRARHGPSTGVPVWEFFRLHWRY